MSVGSGAIDRDNIQKKIRAWIEDADEGLECRAVELVHDHDKQVVQRWPCGRKTSSATLARDIYDVCVGDAEGLGDVQRYILWPYYRGSENPKGRFPFYVIARSAEPDEIDGQSLSEGPTVKGITAMLMRHQNEFFRIGTVMLGKAQDTMLRVNDRQESEIDSLRIENARLVDQSKKDAHESFERQIRWRKVLFWEKSKEELLKTVIPFVPMGFGAIMQKIGIFGAANTGAIVKQAPGPAPAPTSMAGMTPFGFGHGVMPATPNPGAAPPESSNGHDNGHSGGYGTGPNTASPPPAPAPTTTPAGGPSVESRMRRLWATLSEEQRKAFPAVLMSVVPVLQVIPAFKIVEMLAQTVESVRPHPTAMSLLESSVQTFLGSLHDAQFRGLMEGLVQKAGWVEGHVTILKGIARDLGRIDRAFDAAVDAEAPRPVQGAPDFKPPKSDAAGTAPAPDGGSSTTPLAGDTPAPTPTPGPTPAPGRRRQPAATPPASRAAASGRRPVPKDTRVTLGGKKK